MPDENNAPIETVTYPDGTTATGPLPAESPAAPDPTQAVAVSDPAVTAAAGLPSAIPIESAVAASSIAPPPAPGYTPFTPDLTTALRELGSIESLALFWGGEQGVQLRNCITRARLALVGQSHAE